MSHKDDRAAHSRKKAQRRRAIVARRSIQDADALAREAFESGPGRPVTRRDWARLRAAVAEGAALRRPPRRG